MERKLALQLNELNSNELVPTWSSAAKKQRDEEFEDELPRKKTER